MTHTLIPARLRRSAGLICSFFLIVILCTSCSKKPDTGRDAKVTTLGSIEVTAKLLEVKGDLPDIAMYDYAFVIKYEVLRMFRCRTKRQAGILGG